MTTLHSAFLRILGAVLIFVGLIAAYYGPLEIYVFYFFSDGGRFHYEGFGIGTVWFTALVVQNLGYYAIAVVFIPAGIGHLRLRRWALPLTRLYLWFWLGAGILIFGNALAHLPAVLELGLDRDVLLSRVWIAGAAALIALVAAPVAALRFYRSERVRSVFTRHTAGSFWIERYPLPLLAVVLLFVIMIVLLHLALFLQSVFPFFGQILVGRQAVPIVALCILMLGILIYGTVRLEPWAWWASLAYCAAQTVSVIWSVSGYRVQDLIVLLRLPAYEMELFGKLPLLGVLHPVGLVAAPPLTALGLIICSKRYFRHDNSPGA